MISFIIHRPVFVSMIVIGLCLLGVVSYTRLPVELIPDAELPMLIVQVVGVRDADPTYIEQLAVVPIESAIAGLEDIERIESYVDRQRTMIIVYYRQDTDIKFAYLKLQQCVAAASSSLGDEFIAMVWKIDTEQLTNQFMTLQVRGEGDLDQIREIVDRKILPVLGAIDGVANVVVYGGRRRSVEVILHEDALRACNLTPAQVSAKLAQSSTARQYLGQVVDGQREYYVNLVAEYFSVSQLEETVISTTGPVLLKHVATIVDGGAEEESIARINGLESVTISLVRDQQTNLLSLSHHTREVIDRLNNEVRDDGLELIIQDDSAEVIEKNIDIIKNLALVGGILAIVILWIFLRNLSLVLIVATAIPVSVLITLNIFYVMDITINTLTLVGLALAIGMLVDNSVVVLENIHRLLARGMKVRDAVVAGAGEVSRAIIASTLTTVCVFLPFVFSGSFLVRTLGRHVGVSVVSTLLVSLAVAFMLIPVFTYRVLSRWTEPSLKNIAVLSRNNRLLQIYTLLLKSCLRFPARTVIIGLVAFFVSVILCLAVSMNVAEEIELDQFNLYATMPSGTTLASADEQVREMDKRLAEIGEVAERLANISEDDITFTFTLAEGYQKIADRDLSAVKTEIYDKLAGAFPRVNFSYEEPVANVRYRGGGMGRGLERSFARLLGIGGNEERVIVRGQDLDVLRTVADDIQYNIDQLETVRSSSLNISESQPGIDLLFDKSALSHFNIAAQDIAGELSAFQGEFSSGVTMKQGAEEIDVILKSDNPEERTADDLRELQVPTAAGGIMPLLQVSRMVYTDGYSSIYRENQEKQVEVIFNYEEDITESAPLLKNARAGIQQIVDGLSLPAGVAVEVVYDETDLSEFYFLIFAAVVLIYMILASVFESLLTPLSMMFTIPLATIGAFWGLILTGNSLLNANVLVGFLILLGVVVNNGIILIDYSRILRQRKFRPSRALITAGQARVRPILITATTTILGMLPLAMGQVEYVARIGAPFAITVIGGLIAGTLFTLILVPTVSFGMANALCWWRTLDWKIRVVHFIVLAGGFWLIYCTIDSLLWRGANATALLLAVPALTYFIQVSLRRSRAGIIPAGQPITIAVRNVAKIYDDYSRFVREWRKGERQRDRRQREGFVKKALGPIHQVWQLPLYIFHFYYAYIYLDAGFWVFSFAVLFYVYTLYLARPLLLPSGEITTAARRRRLCAKVFWVICWGGPLVNLAWFQLQWHKPVLVAIIGVVWYLAVATYHTSQKLYRDKIDINRITGRFKRMRKGFYRVVKITPVIGKKKVPFRALHGVSLDIENGMFGLVGPNGAGKTTLMRVICGILRQSQGTVRFNDIDLDRRREELQSLIGYLPQEFGTYDNMSAYRFLDYQALLKGMWDPQQRREAVERAIAGVHLDDSRDMRIRAFSGGMKQRVGIAQTLLHLPRVLVVDEPTAGLDPRERIRFRNLLSGLARERIVVFSTHIIEDVSSSCNRLAVLDDGKVKFLGSPLEMVNVTRGFVWQARVDEEMFGNFRKTGWVVHHMWDGDRIRVRVLSARPPLPGAVVVTPTLEDSYIWLLGKEKRSEAIRGSNHDGNAESQ